MGSDVVEPRNSQRRVSFNPRSHVGSDITIKIFEIRRLVSIHAPTWGATHSTTKYHRQQRFQSTLPRGERQRKTVGFLEVQGFNPRSHVGSDGSKRRFTRSTAVSIHAPTWGATNMYSRDHVPFCVSIHAPTWGATCLRSGSLTNILCFNPRSHVGSDKEKEQFLAVLSCFNPRSHVGSDFRMAFEDKKTNVSIHAPTWGATQQKTVGLQEGQVSIHAPTWGATCLLVRYVLIGLFQSTLPRGERRSGRILNVVPSGFNPRSHVGSDRLSCKNNRLQQCFNPRSHVGSDQVIYKSQYHD